MSIIIAAFLVVVVGAATLLLCRNEKARTPPYSRFALECTLEFDLEFTYTIPLALYPTPPATPCAEAGAGFGEWGRVLIDGVGVVNYNLSSDANSDVHWEG